MNNYFGIYVQALLAKNASKTLQKQLDAIKDLSVKVTPNFGKINKSEVEKINKELQTQLTDKLNEASKVEIKPEVNAEAQKKAKDSISELSSELKDVLSPSLKDTSEQFNLFDNFAAKATGTLDGLLGIVGKVALWGVATNAIYGTKRALQDMMDTYVALEDKMVSIERVTEGFNMSKIFDGAYESSQKYGASLTDMLNVTEEIARSYSDLNEEQTLAAAEAGILASTIAEMDGKDAVGSIIAVSNAYGLAIENGERLIDMANEVDNNFSVSAATIATAWERSAATAKTFGVEIETLTGYIAAISTVTQESGSVIGNSLKTIFSRVTTMGTAMDAIKSAGVEIYDSFGQVRKVEDILEDLAGTWDTLSSAQQQNIGVQVAGRYQLTRFLALMNNWEIATNATTTAINSEGSAARENAVYLESYTAKLNQLENAQSQLSETIINGNMAGIGKTWLDIKIALTEMTTEFFKAVDATTFFAGALVTLIGFLAKTANGYKLLENVLKFVTTEQKAAAIATNIAEKGLIKNRLATVLATAATNLKTKAELANVAASTAASKGNYVNAAAQTVVAGTATVAAGAVSLLSKALFSIPGMFIVAAIGFLAKTLIDSANAAAEAKKQLDEQTTSLSKNREAASKLVTELEKLNEKRKTMDEASFDKANAEEQQQILEQLADIYTGISEELLDQNTSLEKKLKLLDDEKRKLADNAKANYEKESGRDVYAQYKFNDEGQMTDEVSEYKVKRNWSDNSFWQNLARVVTLNGAYARDTYKSLDELAGYYEKVIGEGMDYWKLQGDITAEEQKRLISLKELGIENAKSQEDLDKVKSAVYELGEAYSSSGEQDLQTYVDKLTELGVEQSTIDTIINQTVDKLELYKIALDEASEGLSEFNKNTRDVTDMFFGVAEGTEEAITNMNNYIDMFGTSSSLVKGMADDLANSFIFMGEKIFESGEDLLASRDKLNMISETLAIARTNQEFYAQSVAEGTMYVAKGYEKEWEAVRSAKIAELTVEKEALENKINIWKAVLEGTKTMAEASAELARVEGTNNQNKVKSLRDYWESFKTWVKNVIGGYKSVKNASDGDIEAAQKNFDSLSGRLSDVNVQIKQWSDMKIVGTTATDFKKMADEASGAAKKTVDYYDLAEKALLQYKNAVEALDNELKILQERNKQLIEGSQEWFNNFDAQDKVIARYQSSIKEYIKQIEIQMKNDKLSAEEKTKLLNQIQDLNLEYEKLNTTMYNNVQTQKKFYESQITDKLKLIQDLEKERHKDALDNIKKERQAFQDQIKEQLNLMKKASDARSYEKELNELQEERLNILSQISRLEGDDSRLAKSRLQDLYKELEDVEEKIGDLNYDRDIELREGALDDLSTQLDDYYDKLEELENEKNEQITSSIDNAKDSLDIVNQTIADLQKELEKWSNNLSNFSTWAQNFDSLIGTMPTSNIVSSMVPVNQVDAEGNVTTTQIVFNITGSTKDAQNISDTIVDNLIKSGVITTGNTP